MQVTCQTDIKSRIELLRKMQIFNTVSDEVLFGIASELRQVDVKSDEIIFREGDKPDGMFIVEYGCVQLHAGGVEFSIISSGNYFGEHSLIAGEQRSLSALAVTDTKLYYWDKESFESTVSKETNLLKEIVVRLFERLKQKSVLEDELVQKTAEIKAQRQLIAQQNATLQNIVESKDRLLGIIAHDLKNPFNLILGLSEMLLNAPDLPEPKRQLFTEKLNHSAKDVYSLLENLLGWARCQIGEMTYYPETIDLRDLILNNVALYKNIAESKKITLRVEGDSVKAFADIQMIDTVVRNLLSNAIKFTESGYVQLSCEDYGNLVRLAVIDSGVGMPSYIAERLLVDDEHYTTRGTRNEKGTGIGLKLCRRFVEQNNGELSVTSVLGVGTTFLLTLPKPR